VRARAGPRLAALGAQALERALPQHGVLHQAPLAGLVRGQEQVGQVAKVRRRRLRPRRGCMPAPTVAGHVCHAAQNCCETRAPHPRKAHVAEVPAEGLDVHVGAALAKVPVAADLGHHALAACGGTGPHDNQPQACPGAWHAACLACLAPWS